MNTSSVTRQAGPASFSALELLAFAAIYLLWGGTFLAIRISVLDMPPFLTAGTRFFLAGVLLYGVMRWRGAARPSPAEWRNLALIASLMFVVTYGPLFWAAQYVTSSMMAVLEATLPLTAVLLEVAVFRTQPFQWRTALGVGIGFGGVLLLFLHNGGQQLAIMPCMVILGAGAAWSLGAVLTRRVALPASRPLSAGAQMMLGGVVLLGLSLGRGEMHPLPHLTARAFVAQFYLVVFGSIIAYTAYVWLLGRFSATRVSSHAYVNPLVAVVLGHFFAGEIVTARSIAASLVIVASVALILMKPSTKGADFRGNAQESQSTPGRVCAEPDGQRLAQSARGGSR